MTVPSPDRRWAPWKSRGGGREGSALPVHAAERKDVGTAIAGAALELLGRHVLHSAGDTTRHGGGCRSCCQERRRSRRRDRRVKRLRTGGRRPRGQSEVEQLGVRRTRRSA